MAFLFEVVCCGGGVVGSRIVFEGDCAKVVDELVPKVVGVGGGGGGRRVAAIGRVLPIVLFL